MTDRNPDCFFVSDLHGSAHRYETLFRLLAAERPQALFMGGDLLPSGFTAISESSPGDFIEDTLCTGFRRLRSTLGSEAPQVFLILGNDDGRMDEDAIRAGEEEGLWHYSHGRCSAIGEHSVYGYAFVPPTPFMLKDWERYDVSRFVDVGCVSPEEGQRSVPVPENEVRYGTIAEDLKSLTGEDDLSRAVMLFHTPPYQTSLDRAALDGKMVDHVPLDVHVGSMAVRRFIEARQPLVTLHGHIHESARITGSWQEKIGRTICLGAAHDGPELAVVSFRLDDVVGSVRRRLV
jgi:Icc-related predicted phosphoesterase